MRVESSRRVVGPTQKSCDAGFSSLFMTQPMNYIGQLTTAIETNAVGSLLTRSSRNDATTSWWSWTQTRGPQSAPRRDTTRKKKNTTTTSDGGGNRSESIDNNGPWKWWVVLFYPSTPSLYCLTSRFFFFPSIVAVDLRARYNSLLPTPSKIGDGRSSSITGSTYGTEFHSNCI